MTKKILNLPVLGSLWGTALWIVLILHVRSWILSQGSAVQTTHKTCSFLTLHCQKSQSLCLTQSSLTLPIGQYYCWPCLDRVAFAEDPWTFAHADLKRKKLMYKLRLLHRGYSLAPSAGRGSAIWFLKYYARPKYLIFMPVTVVYINPVCKWQCVVSHAQLQLEKD